MYIKEDGLINANLLFCDYFSNFRTCCCGLAIKWFTFYNVSLVNVKYNVVFINITQCITALNEHKNEKTYFIASENY